MVEYSLDKKKSILKVSPGGSLQKEDFEQIAKTVDPFIEESGKPLAGIIINAPAGFPGWKNFSAMIKHFQFIRDHHKKVKKIAFVTDSALGEVAEHVTGHFVSAVIKHFKAGQVKEAETWISLPQ